MSFDFGEIASLASSFAGNQHSSDLFSSAVSAISGGGQNQGQSGSGGGDFQDQSLKTGGGQVDEQQIQRDHKAAYGGIGAGSSVLSSTIGSGAALGAISKFLGQSDNSQHASNPNALVASAMSEAANLWEQHNQAGTAQGSKEDATASAAQTAISLLMKAGGPSALVGGGLGLGNLGQLASMAQMAGKFM